jgi:aminoglycoside phosphotransferase (APT) family kinase protein
MREHVAAFGDFLGERLSPRRRDTFAAVADVAPGLWRWRQEAGRPTTLIHGDAHAWNFLFPKQPGVGPVYLCDWQAWWIAEPTRDLAYLIGLHWFRDHRERFEQPLVRRYHDRLRAEGVADYPWEACWDDYRYSMIHLLWWPVAQWRNGVRAAVWWPHLERGMAAFDDLGCAELLDR